MTPFALATGDVVFQKYQVSLLESLPFGKFVAGFGNVPDVFVAHDHGGARGGLLIQPHIGSADPGDLHFQ
jgi:hypothetical protein